MLSWIKRIDDLAVKAPVDGPDETMRDWKRWVWLNREAKRLYEELDFEIWSRLHQLGYFKMMKGAWPLTPMETLPTLKTPPKDKSYPERLPEDIE